MTKKKRKKLYDIIEVTALDKNGKCSIPVKVRLKWEKVKEDNGDIIICPMVTLYKE